MSVQKADAPIIVKKKVVAHGHHGGAWKVAYADFVTAMMALFIVLWLMNTNQQVQEAVAGYFRDPSGTAAAKGSAAAGTGKGMEIGRDDLKKLKEKLEAAMKEIPALSALEEYVEMTVTGEGLRIELLEGEHGTFFESGNAQPTAACRDMIVMLAVEIGKLPSRISIEGHTDARPYANGGPYTNWELSTDRANSARRLMEEKGVRTGQVAEVRGYADQHLRKPAEPQNASNRRVSIVVQWPQPGAGVSSPAPLDPKVAQRARAHH
jgi:chemotaxis protein MotB